MDTKQINQYWSEARRLVSIAAKYGQKVSLKENLMDESTAWKVKGVFERYYDGSTAKLDNAIENGKKQFEWQVMVFNAACRSHGITEIQKPEKLLGLLLDPARRDFYKKSIKKAKEDHAIFRLQDIEISFRKPSP